MTTATIRVPGLKVTVPLAAAALPPDLVPLDGPAGEPILDLVLEGGSLTVRAKLNGNNYRKLLKQIAEHGADNVAVALQGVLRSPVSPGGPFMLEGAGFQAVVKASRPAEPAGSRRSAECELAAGPAGRRRGPAVSRHGGVNHSARDRPAGIRQQYHC